MKNLNKYFYSIFALTALLFNSCVNYDILEGNLDVNQITSKKIIFTSNYSWGENEDVITKSGPASYGNRIGNRLLSTSDSTISLPLGVYVQNCIKSSSETQTKGSVCNGFEEFSVWCNYQKVDSEALINYFGNIKYKKNTDGVYYPENNEDEYYWPGSGTLNFVSIANAPESGFVSNINETNKNLESFTYTVPVDPTQQNDIIAAYATANGNANTSVPLTFNHILSAINIKVGSVVNGEIRSIKLNNIYNKGTYYPNRGNWIVDKTSTSNFSVKMEGGKFVSNGKNPEGTLINTSDATFMFIPQNPGETAEMIIEFHDGNKLHTLKGSLAGDNWDKSKTINYMLSIDESYTMTIEPVGKKLDAHYIIGYANVTVEGIPSWELTATTSDGSEVTILPEDEVNDLAKQGFWTDYEVDDNGNIISTNDSKFKRQEGKSARGLTKYSGTCPSGSTYKKLFYIFIPENLNNIDREINLVLKGTGESSASTTKVLSQKYPNWTAGGFGWEVVDDDESGKYGFKWTRKVAYVYPYTNLIRETPLTDYCKNFINSYGAGNNGFATVDAVYGDWNEGTAFWEINYGYRAYILLDYSVLNNLTGINSETEGYENTLALYLSSGTTATSEFETIIRTTLKQNQGSGSPELFRKPSAYEINMGVPDETGQNNDLSTIMEYIKRKNRYYLYKKLHTDGEGTELVSYIPHFDINDLKWYLPAYGQFQYFIPDPNNPGDNRANYWSSTAVDGASQAYIGDGTPKDRDLEYRVIAVRKDENNYGQTTTTVDNSSLQGGNNGSTNNWVE